MQQMELFKHQVQQPVTEAGPFLCNGNLEIHEICNLFPMMTPAEMAGLKDSIRKHGLLEPIVLYQGKILDGKCRYEACRAVGAAVWAQKYDIDMDPVEYAVSTNLKRGNYPGLLESDIMKKAQQQVTEAVSCAGCAYDKEPDTAGGVSI